MALAAAVLSAERGARADVAAPIEAAPPDTATGAVVVETMPSGLRVLIDGADAGRSPLGPIRRSAGPVRVRAVPDDPRRFDPARGEVFVDVVAGATSRVFLDVRPSIVLQSVPEPARVLLQAEAAAGQDSLLGETPVAIPAWLLDGRQFRIEATDHADTLVSGSAILDAARLSAPARITLRRVSESAPPKSARAPIYRRRWFQWSLVGIGVGLTGAAIYFKHEGNYWYEQYLVSSDRSVLDEYYDRAVRYDQLSLASLAAGQVFFIGGIFLLVGGSSP